MEIRQIYYVLEIAKHKSFSRAAKELYITQPAITHQIKALEEEFQVKLFKRDTHGVELTEEGHKFCEYAERISGSIDELYQAFQLNDSTEKPLIRVGMFPFYMSSPFRQILTSFFTSNHNVLGNIKVLDNYQAYDMLDSGELDFAVIKSRPEYLRPGYKYELLAKENLYVLIQRDNKLVRGGSIPIELLGKAPLLTGENDSHFYNEMKELYDKNNIPFHVSFMNTKETGLMMDMVKEGVGIVLASEQVARTFESDEIASLLIDPKQEIHVCLAYPQKKNLRGVYLALRNHIIDGIEDFRASQLNQ